jgi:hypothetical protein
MTKKALTYHRPNCYVPYRPHLFLLIMTGKVVLKLCMKYSDCHLTLIIYWDYSDVIMKPNLS